MKKKPSLTQVIRHLIQADAFLLFPGLFIQLYASCRTIVSACVHGTFSFAANAGDLAITGAILPLTILAGRFFCGFLCSFGAMGDLLYFLSGKLLKKRPVIGRKADRILKYGKYLLLLLLVVFVWILGHSPDDSLNPWHVFGVYSRLSGYTSAETALSIGGLLLLAILLLSFFFERFFCRYLCPLGALFALLSPFPLFRIKKSGARCTGCSLCDKRCSMGLSVAAAEKKVPAGECISCMRCLEACPAKALETAVDPAIAGAAAAVAIGGLYYVGNIAADRLTQQPLQSETLLQNDTESKSDLTDGVYRGSASGYRGETEAEVRVENGRITEITILSYRDDASFFNRAKNTVISQILASQSTEVPTVSGATFSSRGIINAVAKALEGIAPSLENTPESTDIAESSSDPSPTPSESPSESPSGSTEGTVTTADGTYTGTGTGFRGEITAEVTVKNGKITDITILSYQDDASFFERAKSGILTAVLDKQSTEVSTVSGATFSSNGILEAIAKALGMTFENPSSENSAGAHGHGKPGRGGGERLLF